MAITADTLRKLSLLNLSSEQMAGVLSILADGLEKEEMRLKADAIRSRNYKSRGGNQVTPELRAQILARDEYTCRCCSSKEDLQIDHIMPLKHGGDPVNPENLQVLCRPCNARKKDKIRKSDSRKSDGQRTDIPRDTPLNGSNGFPHPSLNSLNPTKENTPKGVQKKSSPEKFEEFWESFPRTRRGNKQKAEAAYRQALSRCSADEILTGLNAYADSAEVGNGFAKGAAAWLNDDRWDCDYSTKDPIKSSFKTFDEQRKEANELAFQELLRHAQPS